MKLAPLLLLALPALAQQNTEAHLRTLLQAKTGVVTLPAGTIEITREIALSADAHDLEIKGDNTTLKAASTFRGRALLALPTGKNIKIHDLVLDGNRAAFTQPVAPPQPSAMFSRVIASNGIVAENIAGLELYRIRASQFPGFPILIVAGSRARIHDVQLADSGTLDASGHNNGTGGIAIEEGASDFEVTGSLIGKVRGNGIWIRSTGATTNKGRIANNEFAILARAAIEMNRASAVTIENNIGHMIGFPGDEVLIGGTALPAAIATTGAVDHAVIRANTFDQIAGRCMSLDGLSTSEITGNTCTEGLFNALLIRGAGNRVSANRFLDLNKSKRDQPESLRTAVYLAGGATGNTIEANEISGYGMAQHCVGGPEGVAAANNVKQNACSDAGSLARLNYSAPARGFLAAAATRDTAFTSLRHPILSQSSTTSNSPSHQLE